jgi:hypothetical protein
VPRTRSYGMRVGLQSGVLPYRYALVPWVWDTSGGLSRWRLPASSVGGVDLRPLSAQGVAGGAPQGFAFCTSLQSVTGTAIATVPHMGEANVTTAMQDAWEGATAYRPQGAKLVDLLFDQLTTGSDPDGIDGPKPLMPTVGGQLELHVGGHSLVKSERFRFGIHPHTGKVRDLLRRQFEDQWEATNGDDHCRRCLDFTCKKYKVADWREFVPVRLHAHVPGRLPHATTVTDNFNRADGGLGASWTAQSGTWAISTNEAGTSAGAGWNMARYESDLSSDDHYSQIEARVVTSAYYGGACRCSSSAVTFYSVGGDGNLYLFKLVAGTQTTLTGGAAQAYVVGQNWRSSADGSTIKGYANAVEKASTTDTAITGNLRAGMSQFGNAGRLHDNFEAADLGGGGGRTTRNTRSHRLGVGAGITWRVAS